MATTREEISLWFDIGVETKATHIIVVCDGFDWEDYPVYVHEHQDVHEIELEFRGKSMQTVMEIYCLKMDKETQLNQKRAFNYE